MKAYLSKLQDRLMDADDAVFDKIVDYISHLPRKVNTKFQALGVDQGWSLETFTRERREGQRLDTFMNTTI